MSKYIPVKLDGKDPVPQNRYGVQLPAHTVPQDQLLRLFANKVSS